MQKLLPPVLFTLCLAVMAFLNRQWPLMVVISLPWNRLGYGLIVFGFFIGLWAFIWFRRNQTTLHTFREPIHLVTTGPFRFSRNPMYLGLAIVLLGAWVVMGSLSPIFLVIIFVAVADRWYIRFEERNLEQIFGESALRYFAQTRRWI